MRQGTHLSTTTLRRCRGIPITCLSRALLAFTLLAFPGCARRGEKASGPSPAALPHDQAAYVAEVLRVRTGQDAVDLDARVMEPLSGTNGTAGKGSVQTIRVAWDYVDCAFMNTAPQWMLVERYEE